MKNQWIDKNKKPAWLINGENRALEKYGDQLADIKDSDLRVNIAHLMSYQQVVADMSDDPDIKENSVEFVKRLYSETFIPRVVNFHALCGTTTSYPIPVHANINVIKRSHTSCLKNVLYEFVSKIETTVYNHLSNHAESKTSIQTTKDLEKSFHCVKDRINLKTDRQHEFSAIVPSYLANNYDVENLREFCEVFFCHTNENKIVIAAKPQKTIPKFRGYLYSPFIPVNIIRDAADVWGSDNVLVTKTGSAFSVNGKKLFGSIELI